MPLIQKCVYVFHLLCINLIIETRLLEEFSHKVQVSHASLVFVSISSEFMSDKAEQRSIIHSEVITQSHWPHLWPHIRWPPGLGRPGSRWAGIWDITTCCDQFWLATFLCGWTMRVCHQSRVWVACCLALAAPGPDRSSWATAQVSHYSCGVLALGLLHTAALGVLHQLPVTIQSSLCKDTAAKERAGGGWEVFLPRILKDCNDIVLWKVILQYTTFTHI